MSERDRITPRQDHGAQKRWPCGDDPAGLVTAPPDSRRGSYLFNRYTVPVRFALFGALRVQWASAPHVQRRVTPSV
jgi:hypothetical protein